MVKRLLGKFLAKGYARLMQHHSYRWMVLLGTLIYLISPLDIVPDVIPVVGWIDDGLIATLAVTEIAQLLLERKRRPQYQRRSRLAQDVRQVHVPSSGPVIDVEAVPSR